MTLSALSAGKTVAAPTLVFLLCLAPACTLGPHDERPASASARGPSPAELTRRAQRGDAEAQVSLGAMYDEGRGVPADEAEAARWYRLAAQQNNARAQYAMGALAERGAGVPRSDEDAARWYRLAAEQVLQVGNG